MTRVTSLSWRSRSRRYTSYQADCPPNADILQVLQLVVIPVVRSAGVAPRERIDECSSSGYVMTMAPYGSFTEGHMTSMSLIGGSTNKLKPVARSFLSTDIQEACSTEVQQRLLWSELTEDTVWVFLNQPLCFLV